jgi:UV DNA damage endonuclease
MESLMDFRFGLYCSNADNSLSTNHTFMLKSLTFENIEKKVKQNVDDLEILLELCHQNEYKVFRLGNSFIPFLSHELFKPKYKELLSPLLQKAKEIIGSYDIRITMHPSQFVVLNSPNQQVIDKSLHELKEYFWLFDTLGIDENGTILIHGGGAYGDKISTMSRFKDTIEKNPWLKERLAIENDERTFNASDISTLCLQCDVPFVFDIYHHSLNLSHFDKEIFMRTWHNKIPKVHISSKGEGRFGKHADFIEAKDFHALWDIFGDDISNVDIMVEAKQKENAIEKLKLEI